MARKRTTGIGVIGCGTIAYWKHLRNLGRLSGVRVAGLVDPDAAALDRARRLLDAPVFPTVDELLASRDVDAVVIATPTPMHAAHLAAACQAGKAVYLEKPVAHDTVSLRSVERCVEGKVQTVAVGYNLRFHPGCLLLRQHVCSGSLGDVRAVVSHFVEPYGEEHMPAWRKSRAQGGGVLLDLGTHHMDLYRWLLKDELAHVAARIPSRGPGRDSAWLEADTRGNVELLGYFSYATSRSHRISVHGSAAVMHLDLHTGVVREERNRRSGYGVRRRALWSGPADLSWRLRKRVQPSYDPSFRSALRAFIDSAAGIASWHPDLATLHDGVAAVRAVLEAEAAAFGGGDMPAAAPDPL